MTAAGEPAHPSKEKKEKLSPRQKGVRQGILLMVLSLILVPAYVLLAALFPANDRLVESAVSDTPFEKISQAILLTMFLLGLMRALYAYFFQRSVETEGEQIAVGQLNHTSGNLALPPGQSIPASGFGKWRTNSGEIAKPSRVRENDLE